MADISEPDESEAERQFLSQLPFIDSVIRVTCLKSHLSPEDAEDFASDAKAKLIDRNYDVFRRFEGRSSLRTYLLVVLRNALLDWQNQKLGKWRHSAEAVRLGEVAQKIEELSRDGFSFDEICAILRSHYKVTLSERELADLRGRLSFRVRRRWTGEEALQNVEGSEKRPDERLLQREEVERRQRAVAAARAALADLPAEDRIFFWVAYVEQKVSVAQYAKARGLNAKELYRRAEKISKKLRRKLTDIGFRKEDLNGLL
jgi:RNA polymerase sigma factor (sigma-70 family)